MTDRQILILIVGLTILVGILVVQLSPGDLTVRDLQVVAGIGFGASLAWALLKGTKK